MHTRPWEETTYDHHHSTQIPQMMGLTTVEEQAAAVLDALRKGGGEWERKLPNTTTTMTEQQGIYINETQRIDIQQQQQQQQPRRRNRKQYEHTQTQQQHEIRGNSARSNEIYAHGDDCEMQVDEEMHDDHEKNEINHQDSTQQSHQQSFTERIPVLKTIRQRYDLGRGRNTVLNYSIDKIESSISHIASYPMVARITTPVLQGLDSFACTQLDRIEKVYPTALYGKVYDKASDLGEIIIKRVDNALALIEARIGDYEETNLQQHFDTTHSGNVSETGIDRDEVSSTSSGNIGPAPLHRLNRMKGAVSRKVGIQVGRLLENNNVNTHESMQKLRFCLRWLLYALSHIEAQIAILKQSASKGQDEVKVIANTARKEVAVTVKKVVQVIGQYASGCLHLEGRSIVRTVILSFPEKWGQVFGSVSAGANQCPRDALGQVIKFAEEAREMMSSIAKVFALRVEEAEGWMHWFGGKAPAECMSAAVDQEPVWNSNIEAG